MYARLQNLASSPALLMSLLLSKPWPQSAFLVFVFLFLISLSLSPSLESTVLFLTLYLSGSPCMYTPMMLTQRYAEFRLSPYADAVSQHKPLLGMAQFWVVVVVWGGSNKHKQPQGTIACWLDEALH